MNRPQTIKGMDLAGSSHEMNPEQKPYAELQISQSVSVLFSK
jgi:hypothetical protein